jgi:hypothetical protein
MRLTKRDINVIEFIKEFRVASTSDLIDLFGFNQPNCNRRLKQLMEEFKDLKKIEYNPTYNFYNDKYNAKLKNQNVYYWKRKSKSIEHDLLINRFYIELKQSDLIIKEFKREYRITLDDFTIIADANITLEYNGKEYNYLLELENNKSFNYKKYYKLELEGIEFPTVIVCSNRKVYNYCKKVKVLKVGLNLDGLIKKIKNDMIQKEYGYKVNKF